MKACFKCGASKDLEAFYRHPMMADGHLNKCIDCTKTEARANRAARIEFYQAYDRSRARSPERREARLEAQRRAPRTRPEPDQAKRFARIAVGNAVRDGTLVRPPQCDICSLPCEPHGHHDDYSKPLDVIWCCVPCHALIHAYWRAQQRSAA